MTSKLKVIIIRLLLGGLKLKGKVLQHWAFDFLIPIGHYFVHQTNSLREARTARYVKLAGTITDECNALVAKFKTLPQPVEASAHSRMVFESRALQSRSAALTAEIRSLPPLPVPGADLLLEMLGRTAGFNACLQVQIRDLQQLVDDLNSPHFYSNLVLFLLLPSSSSRSQIGDLEEEYISHVRIKGVGQANTWYTRQAVASVADRVWQSISRLAALIQVGELLERLFKRH